MLQVKQEYKIEEIENTTDVRSLLSRMDVATYVIVSQVLNKYGKKIRRSWKFCFGWIEMSLFPDKKIRRKLGDN